MKNLFWLTRTSGLCLLLCAVLVSCKKDEEAAPPTDNFSTERKESNQDAFADHAFSEAQKLADEAAATGQVNQRTGSPDGILNHCATVTRDTVATPHLITIDFGSANCLGHDGRSRRGKILVSYTGPYRQAGTVINITFDNYFVNDNQLLGTKNISNMGTDSLGRLHYQVLVNGQIAFQNGDTLSWQSARTRTWTAGAATVPLADDEYQITGTGTATRPSGQTVTYQIMSPLLYKMAPGCRRHFISGELQITPANRPVRLLNYGTGTCDNLATVTINGQTFQITLP